MDCTECNYRPNGHKDCSECEFGEKKDIQSDKDNKPSD